MKTKKSAFRITLFLVAALLYGCPNEGPHHVYTRINPDGSCYRELIRSADSAFVIKGDTSHNPFPMKLDSFWKISFYKRVAGDTSRFANWPVNKTYKTDSGEFSWFATAVREYSSVEEMARSFRFDDSDWNSVKPVMDFNKKFRWFYTYYEYIESYPSANPFKAVPISEYMTDDQVAALYGEDRELYRGKNGFEIRTELDELNEKADKWLEHNLYEEIYQLYIDNYDRFDNAPVDKHAFAMEKDTIYKYYVSTDSMDFDDIDELLNHHFRTNAYTADDDFDEMMTQKFGMILTLSNVELNYKLSMPGKVIETTAPFVNKDTLTWRVEDDRFFFNNYTLQALSRKPNYWAFAVTGVVVALALLGFLVKRKPA